MQTDPLAVAAAERLRAVSSEANIGMSKASIDYSDTSPEADSAFGTSILALGNNPSAEVATAITANNFKPAFVIPKGTDKVSLMMEVPARSEKLERFRDDLDSLHQRLRDSQGLPEVELLDESEMEEMMAKLAAGGLGRRRAAS